MCWWYAAAVKEIKNVERELKALANKRRLAILIYLRDRERASVGVIAGQIKLSFKSTSHHLRLLANADILEKEQSSTVMWYSLKKPHSVLIKEVLRMF